MWDEPESAAEVQQWAKDAERHEAVLKVFRDLCPSAPTTQQEEDFLAQHELHLWVRSLANARLAARQRKPTSARTNKALLAAALEVRRKRPNADIYRALVRQGFAKSRGSAYERLRRLLNSGQYPEAAQLLRRKHPQRT
jgi:hypothetical protein